MSKRGEKLREIIIQRALMILLNFPSTYAVILLMTGGGSLPVAVEGMLPMSLQSALSRYTSTVQC